MRLRLPFRAITLWILFASLTALPALAERPKAAGPADFAAKMTAWDVHQDLEKSSLFHGLAWRDVGPVVQGGRVVDIESVPGEPYTFYVAYASAGIWKTTNNGVTFEPLSDDQPTMIIGDMAVDPKNPETLWVGTGENNSSRSSYGGLGVYRSDDGGETWTHKGLEESDRIGRVLIDPRNTQRVFVASLGKLYTPGGQRGVFRTDNGGDTWKEVLPGGEWTGVIDLVMDPKNPDVLYAASWERSRRPWDFVEGGSGSGIWKTTDGGDHWTRLEGGFPQGEHVGRIGLAIYPENPQILYAALDNQEPLPEELWDLGDGAVTAKRLRKMSKEEFLQQDPEAIEDFIRSNDLDTGLDAAKLIDKVREDELSLEDILAELDDANANLFNTDIRGIEVWRSEDAGVTWTLQHDDPIRGMVFTYGYYFGQIRVAPDDPERIYILGVPILTSADGGKTYETIQDPNVHVDYHDLWIDPAFPQRLIAGNDGGLDVSYDGGATWLKIDAQSVGQFYTVEVDMAEPYNVYGGLQDNGVLKGSSQSKPGRDLWQVIGGGDGMYIQVDTRDNETTYLGYQFGFYSRLGGGPPQDVRPRDKLGEPALRYNWATPILLSVHNRDVLYFGANKLYRSLDKGETWTAISPDLTRSEERGDVPFATLTSIDESPHSFGLLWAGTDDGYIHVSEDGGVEWREVSGALPADRWVSRVEASNHDRDVAYVSLNGYRDDDITAYVYRTEDLGQTWTDLSEGLPDEAVNVVREDPVNRDVLYAGTDRGVYVSIDRGVSWQALQSGLPNVPVHDLIVHPRDRELVAGTHGRSIWIVDVLPVQDLTAEVREKPLHVFPVESVAYDRSWRGRFSPWFARYYEEESLHIPVWIAEGGEVELIIADEDGRSLRQIRTDVKPGINTLSWDLRLDSELALDAEKERLAAQGEAADAQASDAKSKKKKEKGSAEAKPEEGGLAKTPWAEAVRLDWPLYVTPGTYSLIIRRDDAEAQTELVVDPAPKREPRMREEPAIRGRKKGQK